MFRIGLVMNKLKVFLELLKRHYKNFRKDLYKHMEVFRYAKGISENKAQLKLFDKQLIEDARGTALSYYNKEKASIIKEEMEEVIKKENENS